MDRALPAGLDATIERARSRATKSGELHPQTAGPAMAAVPVELGEFVSQILSDGTYARAVERIGREDADIATI